METLYRAVEQPRPETSPSLVRPRRRRSFLSRLLASWKLYLALLPTLLILGLLSYYPAINGLYHSFFLWQPGYDSPFTGLENFKAMLSDSVFLQSFGNIVQFFLFGITLAWLLPLLAAELVLTLSSKRWQFLFRTLLILSLAFPLVVVYELWGFIYDPQVGLLNSFLHALGLGALAQNWLGNPSIALYSLMLLGIPWIASTPFLIFLAGLQSIPKEIYDAAAIDGVGWLRRIIFIDVPLLLGQFRLLLVLAIISFIQLAVPMALLTNGGPAYATMTPALYMINTAFFDGNWGYAAAISTVLFVITLAFSFIVLRVQRRQAAAV